MKTVGIYPGTFDPITKGHLDIVVRASKIVDNLIVAVAKDTGKNPIFSQEERKELVEKDVHSLNLVNVQVIPFEGLLVDFLKKYDANFIAVMYISFHVFGFLSSIYGLFLNSFLQISTNSNFIL